MQYQRRQFLKQTAVAATVAAMPMPGTAFDLSTRSEQPWQQRLSPGQIGRLCAESLDENLLHSPHHLNSKLWPTDTTKLFRDFRPGMYGKPGEEVTYDGVTYRLDSLSFTTTLAKFPTERGDLSLPDQEISIGELAEIFLWPAMHAMARTVAEAPFMPALICREWTEPLDAMLLQSHSGTGYHNGLAIRVTIGQPRGFTHWELHMDTLIGFPLNAVAEVSRYES